MKTTFSKHVLLAVVSVIVLLNGCGRSNHISPTLPPGDNSTWENGLMAPAPFLQALSRGFVEYIPSEDELETVPVRIFNAGGTKTPILFTHGLQSHSGWFAQSAAHLADLGHPVYAMDRKGSGLSTAPRGDAKNFQEWVEEIHLVAKVALQRHNADQFYLVGHCFGAIPATAYAVKYPETLKGLILSTPAIYTKTTLPVWEMLRIATSQTGKRDFAIPLPLDLESFTELPEYQEFIANDSLSLVAATGDFYWQVHMARKYIARNINLLQMPILMLIAAEDPICHNGRNREFFFLIPAREKTLVEFGNARHILEFSPEKQHFFTALSRWLTYR